MSLKTNKQIIQEWMNEVIIGLNLCPFAKNPWENEGIRLQESSNTNEEKMLQDFLYELNFIQSHGPKEISTSLLIFPMYQQNFFKFNDFCGACEALIDDLNLDQIFQVVAFHPNFQFANLKPKDKANLVNSSPFPLIHILRSEELAQVIKNSNDGEKISFANEKRLKELSETDLKKFFPWKYK